MIAAAQEPPFRDAKIIKKPGEESGPVVAIVSGRQRQILPKATKVWPAMGGQDLIALIPPSQNQPQSKGYTMRLFNVSARKGHSLGVVPFGDGEFSEQLRSDGSWIFLLKGADPQSKTPLLIVADVQAIRALVSDPRGNKPDEATLSALLAVDMRNIFATATPDRQVQFLDDGSSVVIEAGKQPVTGRWWTNGEMMTVLLDGDKHVEFPRASLTKVVGVPAGSRLVVRLLQSLSSHTAKEGMPIEVVLISPIIVDGKVLIPPASKLKGTVTNAQAVGMAVVHETAKLTLKFDQLEFPDGTTRILHSRLRQVDNSREKVDETGTILGIRTTGTLGYSATSMLASVTAVDPVAYLFTSVTASAVLGFTEAEIMYPAGTELQVELTAPLVTSQVFPFAIPVISRTETERQEMRELVRSLPFRTATQAGDKPSDLTNLAFLGPVDGVRRAFQAAGWVNVDQLTAASTFQTLKSIAGDEGYSEAPMSTLLLDERPPVFTLSKTTNTFSSRHHLRVFEPGMRYQGLQVLTSSSTQDIGIAFSRKQKNFIHVIDEYIDNERSQVVNDLSFTGCVDAMELVPRSWVPLDAYNATGDRLRTDGAIAVMRINECSNPTAIEGQRVPPPPLFNRSVRNTMLTLRNMVWRGNVAYQGVDGGRKLHGAMADDDELKPESGAWRKADISGAEYEGVGDIPADRQSSVKFEDADATQTNATADRRWDPPRREIAVEGGYLQYPNKQLEAVGVFMISPQPDLPPYAIGLFDDINDGWSAGISVTLNTWRWVSSEFGYHLHRGKYRLERFNIPGDIDEQGSYDAYTVGLATRQFEYNALFHVRPRESRWRPYVAVGPALQLIYLTDAPVRRAPSAFKLGLQNIGLLKAAFDFGRTPP
ncbi:MAG TPA: LssY C-terminal domain-containing protein, partial [Bryobacteraceae bacterium]|nr:LssY C-terminal domain-containing protein [Bryobacteraceae bacterium]